MKMPKSASHNCSHDAAGTSERWYVNDINYWREVCRDRVNNGLFKKRAELGGGADNPFEQAFANLAHAYLRDKAPKLLEYEVGFQLIEKNQENTKAVGVFGFKIGDQWLYAPVFFLNGDLKGHELLYIKHQDIFVPMKDNWLNYLLGRKPNILGKGIDRNLSNSGVTPPSLYRMSRSPYKYASASPRLAAWLRDFMPTVGYLATTSLAKEATTTSKSFIEALRGCGRAGLNWLDKVASEWPAVFSVANEIYGSEFKKIAEEVDRNERTAKSALSLLHSTGKQTKPVVGSVLKSAAKKTIEPGGLVQVYMRQDIFTTGKDIILNEEDRDQVIHNGRVVKDNRDDKDIAKVYDTTTSIRLSNPTETGIYEVLVRPFRFEKCLVIKAPYGETGRQGFYTVVSLEKKNRWINIHPTQLFVRTQYSRDQWNKWFDSLPDADSLTPTEDRWANSNFVVLIERSGQGTCPFNAYDEHDDDDDQRVYSVSWSDYCKQDKPYLVEDTYRTRYHSPFTPESNNALRIKHVRFTNNNASKPRAVVDELQISRNFKVLNLQDKSDDCCSHSMQDSIQPGNLTDIQLALVQGTIPLKVISKDQDADIVINGRPLDKASAFKHLVVDWNLRANVADHILQKAAESKNKVFEYRVKEAAATQVNEGPSAPGIPEPFYTQDSIIGRDVPTMMNDEREFLVNDMLADPASREKYRPIGPDPQTMQIAQQAATSGQRELFDTSMLGSLLKAVRHDNMVDRYQGDLMKGMDRLGRIYFQFLWHGPAFEKRYGKQDLPELEDGLRNAFEMMGDIVLILKRKSVEPFADEGTDIDLGNIANQ